MKTRVESNPGFHPAPPAQRIAAVVGRNKSRPEQSFSGLKPEQQSNYSNRSIASRHIRVLW